VIRVLPLSHPGQSESGLHPPTIVGQGSQAVGRIKGIGHYTRI
jgi:hypothetical protein